MPRDGLNGAEWYVKRDPLSDRYYEIFFGVCNHFQIDWANASEKERFFVEEVTRVTFERECAVNQGKPLSEVRPSFCA